MSQAVAVIHREEILERIRAGEILREIAPDFGVTKQALHKVLIDDPEYQVAKRIQAASMIEQAKVETWAAREQVDIARAREVSRFAFRYAESVDPGSWAPRSHVTVETVGDLGDRLRRAEDRRKGRTIDAQPVSDAQIVATTPLAKPQE